MKKILIIILASLLLANCKENNDLIVTKTYAINKGRNYNFLDTLGRTYIDTLVIDSISIDGDSINDMEFIYRYLKVDTLVYERHYIMKNINKNLEIDFSAVDTTPADNAIVLAEYYTSDNGILKGGWFNANDSIYISYYYYRTDTIIKSSVGSAYLKYYLKNEEIEGSLNVSFPKADSINFLLSTAIK